MTIDTSKENSHLKSPPSSNGFDQAVMNADRGRRAPVGTFKQLQDTDPMPFGKYSKTNPPTLMQDVPADYFFYLWTKCGLEHNKQSPVADYIRRNLSALSKEYRDGIWEP